MISSWDPAELKHYWKAWHNYTSYDIKNQYLKFIGHLNNMAKLNNVSDVIAYHAKPYYTECPVNFNRIYENIKPLYLQLYTYVRKLLRNKFGPNTVAAKGPIPVHLLGSVLGQPWTNLIHSMPDEFVPDKNDKMDIKTPKRLFDQANGFYSSIGMGNLPKSVWARSLFKKSDEFVDCQPSSWDIYKDNDFRIKICCKGGAEDVYKFHAQIGLVHYFMAYKKQPIVYQRPADTVFSESLINALVLSVRYQDFIDRHSDSQDSRHKFLLQMALKKVSILPFAYASDLWHTGVFKRTFAPKHMNDFWWSKRLKYEGVSSPIAKGKDKSANSNYKPFDPSASYSVLTELPQIKYFLQPIIEFQIFKALCIACGEYDPKHADTKQLYECNLRGYKKIAKIIKPVMSKGASVKWQSLLETIVGHSRLDANPMLEYFRTLYDHLWTVNNQTNEFLGWKTNAT
ncbi:angiotensin-converting enzyme-like isoform X2 [Adelges cooleyi]|nr:angiotensin-converting enzyme-like isoform X2 [Adelges cooleyi]